MKKSFTLVSMLIFANMAFSQVSPQVYTASGSFVVPSGATSITVEAIGEGGSGGGNGGGGGGGGGYASGTYTVTPLSTLTITIGSGGTATATTISGLSISAGAGGNGTSVANPNLGGGGAGGIGTGGTTAYRTGGTGGGGYWTYFGGGGGGAAGSVSNGTIGGNTIVWNGSNCLTPGGTGGANGGAPAGDGGKGAGFVDNNCSVSNPAAVGANHGGGGGGGNGNGGQAATGNSGYVSISWLSTDVASVSATEQLEVFPNPFVNQIKLKNAKGTEAVELIDNLGKVVWKGKNIEQYDFSGYTAGVYIIRVVADASTKIYKLIKE